MEYDIPINDKIDAIPPPTTCIDGLQRHFQAYEQTVNQLQRENQELRDQLAQALRQIDVMRTQQLPIAQVGDAAPNVGATPKPKETKQIEEIQSSTAKAPPATLPGIKSGKQLRHVQMHSRAIVRLQIRNNLLLTGSRDGTARLWTANDAVFKTSLFTFRAPCQIVAVNLLVASNVVAVCAKNRRCYLYNMDTVSKQLGEYADIHDLNDCLMKHVQSQENYIQLDDHCASVAELNSSQLLLFGRGFISQVSVEKGSFNLSNTQSFSEASQASEPLYFCQSVNVGSNAYVVVRERFIQKSNQQFMAVQDQPASNQLAQYNRTGARILQITPQFKIVPFTLAQNAGLPELTPLSLFTVDAKILLLFSAFEQKLAVFDTANNQFAYVKEANAHAMEGAIMCGCSLGKQIYIAVGNTQFEAVKVLVYTLEASNEIKLQETIVLDDYCGYATSIAVGDGQIAIGGLDGAVAVRQL